MHTTPTNSQALSILIAKRQDFIFMRQKRKEIEKLVKHETVSYYRFHGVESDGQMLEAE